MPFALLTSDQAFAVEPPPVNFTAPAAPSTAVPEASWSDIAKSLGQNFLRDLAGAVGGKVSQTFNPTTEAELARARAAEESRRKADQQRLFLIVGGVAAAVVVGALVLRRGS